MTDNVILLTVTYNSSHFLERLVKAAHSQTYKLNRIVVVDNASNEEHSAKIKKLCNEYPEMEVVRSEENLGGAGGFQKGTEYILEHYPDCDWEWIMDDDAFPRLDCLENLLKYSNIKDIGCLAPLIYGIELQKYQLYHHKLVTRYLDKDIAAIKNPENTEDITSIDSNAFVGPLIKMSVIKKIGVPDGSLFIYGDDLEYIYRVSRNSKVYLVKSAVINHRDMVNNSGAINPSGLWKEYYQYRNRILFIEKYKAGRIAGWIGKLLVTKMVMRGIVVTLLKSRYKGFRRVKIYCDLKGLYDGLRNVSGKTIDPNEFKKYLT